MRERIIRATLVAGTLDIFSAFVFAGMAGTAPHAVLQFVASGPLGDRARGDQAGFYDGIIVRHAGQELVIVGPPVMFVAGEEAQLSLF